MVGICNGSGVVEIREISVGNKGLPSSRSVLTEPPPIPEQTQFRRERSMQMYDCDHCKHHDGCKGQCLRPENKQHHLHHTVLRLERMMEISGHLGSRVREDPLIRATNPNNDYHLTTKKTLVH